MLFTFSTIYGLKKSGSEFKDYESEKTLLKNVIIDVVAAIIITLGVLMACKCSMFGFSGSVIVGSSLIGLTAALYLTIYAISLSSNLKRYQLSQSFEI